MKPALIVPLPLMWKAPFSKFGGGAHIGRSAMESECDDDAIKSDDDDCDILKMIWRWNEMEEYILYWQR